MTDLERTAFQIRKSASMMRFRMVLQLNLLRNTCYIFDIA